MNTSNLVGLLVALFGSACAASLEPTPPSPPPGGPGETSGPNGPAPSDNALRHDLVMPTSPAIVALESTSLPSGRPTCRREAHVLGLKAFWSTRVEIDFGLKIARRPACVPSTNSPIDAGANSQVAGEFPLTDDQLTRIRFRLERARFQTVFCEGIVDGPLRSLEVISATQERTGYVSQLINCAARETARVIPDMESLSNDVNAILAERR